MYIEKINVIDFGGTKNKEIVFDKKLNVIQGDNESGKSTICAFIRFIFFGFSDKKERMRYYSFGSSGAGGTLTLSCNEKRYRIEREYIENSRDSVSVIDLATNAPVFEGENPGDVFFGLNAEVYDHTAYIPQIGGGYVNGNTVSESIENILFGADETLDTKKALKRLDEARVVLSHKRGDGGRINELKQEKENLISEMEKAKKINAQIIEKEGSLRETKRVIAENAEKATQNSDLIEYYETAASYRLYKQYRQVSKKAAETEAVLNALEQSYEKDGFLPDSEYVERLRYLNDEIESIDESINLLNKEKSDLNARNTDLYDSGIFVEKADENGGVDELCDRFDRIDGRKTLLLAFSIISGVLAIVLAILGYFGREMVEHSVYYGIGIGIVFVILSVIFLISSNKQKMNLEEFLTELDLNNEEEFELAVANYEDNAKKLDRHNLKLDEYERAYESLAKERAERQDEAMQLALKWGKNDISTALRKAEEAYKRLSESRAEAEKYAMSRDLLKPQVENLDKNELKAKLNGREYGEEIFDKQQVDTAVAQREFYLNINEKLKEKETELEKDLAVLYATGENAVEIKYQISEIDEQINFLSEKHSAFLLAYKKLEEASMGLRAGVIPRLTSVTGDIISAVTGGKYSSVGIGKKFDLMYDYAGNNHPIDYLSEGTKDVAYYALRLALVRVLYKKELPTVIFDESFARLDKKRQAAMFSVLNEISQRGVQFFIFTSAENEAKNLSENKIDFNYILI